MRNKKKMSIFACANHAAKCQVSWHDMARMCHRYGKNNPQTLQKQFADDAEKALQTLRKR